MVDLAQLVRDEIERQGLTQYRIALDTREQGTPIDQPSLSQFLRGGDMRLARASIMFDYLGLKVVRVKKPKRR